MYTTKFHQHFMYEFLYKRILLEKAAENATFIRNIFVCLMLMKLTTEPDQQPDQQSVQQPEQQPEQQMPDQQQQPDLQQQDEPDQPQQQQQPVAECLKNVTEYKYRYLPKILLNYRYNYFFKKVIDYRYNYCTVKYWYYL
jgi:hypothetical protein